ncbi:MAG: response regulator transcription factor [Anaerolineales bacterium]|nr:response regulator transcription factor [Anaerolineales bacterium]
MVRVLICDDQLIVCEGLEKILASDPEINLVGIANDGLEALALIPESKPNIVLMDLKMPRMNGVVATRKIKEKYPDTSVIILTTYDDDEWVFDAIRSGAAGYLLKDLPPADLIKAIKETDKGKSFVDPSIAPKLLTNISETSLRADPPTNFQLSGREIDILTLITKGYTNADIAEALFLSEGTIRNYVSDLLRTLEVSDRTQAAVVAIKYGLVDLSD